MAVKIVDYVHGPAQAPLPADSVQSTTSVQEAVDRQAAPTLAAPAAERAFVETIAAYAARYQSAANDMARGAERPARARAICGQLRLLNVADWLGRVEELSSNNEGKGVLMVRISSVASVRTWNNTLSDTDDGTLIQVGSPVHEEAMALKEGETVVFSGSFFRDRDDCIRETSLTMEGGMTDPAFLVRFSAIRPAQ